MRLWLDAYDAVDSPKVISARMRILAISNYYPPLIKGGLEISASIICRSLADAGHEVHVLTRESEPREESLTENLFIHRIFHHKYRFDDIPGRPQRLHGWHAVDAAFRNGSVNKPILKEFLKCKSFDVAICFSLQDIGTSLASELGRQGIPVLWSVADYWHLERKSFGDDGFLARLRKHLLLRKETMDELGYPFDNIVFISEYIRRAYADAGIRPSKSYVVHRSYPVQPSVEPYPSGRFPSFLVACQLGRHKGIHVVVAAAAELVKTHGDKQWTVDVYGDGDPTYLTDLRNQVQRFELANRVQFHAKVGHDEVGRLMQKSMAFIHSAIWEEPFGRVAIESMANGVPLIAGKASAIQEIVEKDGALLYDREDPFELAEMMRVVLDDPDRCAEMARIGILRHAQFFVPAGEQAKMLQILEEIAFDRPETAP